MFVVLDGGLALPVPSSVGTDPFQRSPDITDYRWKADKQDRWLRAYTHCLYSLHSQFDEPVHIIEVQCGEYLGEDDIVRLEDNYGREGTTT